MALTDAPRGLHGKELRKPISFRLPMDTINQLDHLARGAGLQRTAMLESLIAHAHSGRPVDRLGRAIAAQVLNTLASAIGSVGAAVLPDGGGAAPPPAAETPSEAADGHPAGSPGAYPSEGGPTAPEGEPEGPAAAAGFSERERRKMEKMLELGENDDA